MGLDDPETTEDDDMSVLEFCPDDANNSESTWETNNNCSRWIVIDGLKPSQETELKVNIDVGAYL